MADMASAIILIILGTAFLTWLSYRRSKHYSAQPSKRHSSQKTKKTYTLTTEPAELVDMTEPTDRLFTYKDERHAYKARQPLWMRYQDKAGTITERVVEIYNPEDDEVLFTWCRMKQEPRTFARRNIQSWRLLPERFVFDPLVARYWKEEGTLGAGDSIPWRRWILNQSDADASRHY